MAGYTLHSEGLAFDRGGERGPLLVLIHGLGATAGVWSAMIEASPNTGRWLVPDLPGHGGSAARDVYTMEAYAAALGSLIAAEAGSDPVTVLGHSLGGVIALALARGTHGFVPAQVFALGIKVDWAEEELVRFAGLAERAPRLFSTEAEALDQFRKQAGLTAVSSGSPLLARGAARDGSKWRAAFDPRAFRVERPDITGLMAAARCPVGLACGIDDPMVSLERLRVFTPSAIAIAGAGHNAMVDAPRAVWDWIQYEEA